MIKIYLSGRTIECDTCEQVLEAVKNNGMFTCMDSLDEYVGGLKDRIKVIYGKDVSRLGSYGIVRFLSSVGELKVEGI